MLFGGVPELRPREWSIDRRPLRVHEVWGCLQQRRTVPRREEVGDGQAGFRGGRYGPVLDAPVLPVAEHLHDIRHIDAQGIGLRENGHPSPIFEHFQSTNILLVQNRQQISVDMRNEPQHLLCAFRFVVVVRTHHCLRFLLVDLKVSRIHSQTLDHDVQNLQRQRSKRQGGFLVNRSAIIHQKTATLVVVV